MSPSHAPKPNSNDTSLENVFASLKSMKKARVAVRFAELQEAGEGRSDLERLALALEIEAEQREAASLHRRVRKIRLPWPTAAVVDYDDAPGRGCARSALLDLEECRWVDKGFNLIITGPVGSGKSWVASALGNAAVHQGKSVVFYTVRNLLADFHQACADGTVRALQKRLGKARLLIVDDWGMVDLRSDEVDLLCCALEERLENQQSILVASHLSVSEWGAWCLGRASGASLAKKLSRVAIPVSLNGEVHTAETIELSKGNWQQELDRVGRSEPRRKTVWKAA